MKILMIAAATTASMIGSVAFADVQNMAPASKTYTICAEEARFGWKLSGTPGSTFTSWGTNKAIGQIIGDGNCESGWTMSTNMDARVFEEMGASGRSTFNSTGTAVTDVSVQTVDAGRMTNRNVIDAFDVGNVNTDVVKITMAPAVVIINEDNGAKKKFVKFENGSAYYRVVREGTGPNATPVGTVQEWDFRKWIERTNALGCTGNNCHKTRYSASRDVTTTELTTTQYVNVRSVRVSCPTVYNYIFSGPSGAVVVNNGRVKACTTKIVNSRVAVGTNVRSSSSAGDKYIDVNRLIPTM
jgi:hypothetical protein